MVVAACLLATLAGCGDDSKHDGAEACTRFAAASCRTDEACSNTDPCSMDCDVLGEPDNADALDACVNEYEAIAIPSDASDPLGHAKACADRSSKKLDCLGTF
jgi:hypothetical protein